MVVDIGLGVVPGERSFFHENEQHYQERSHRSKKKNEHIERVLKNIGTIFNHIHLFPLTLFKFINKF